MRAPRTSLAILGGTAAITLALSGCASTATSAADDGELRIVASTDVYGDIAEQIVGDLAEVTSIITSAAQDPHSYEASAQDQLALSRADLVIENGAGYDSFIETLIADNTTAEVLSASETSGLLEESGEHSEEPGEHSDEEGDQAQGVDEHAGEEQDHIEGFNEHVWYSFHGVERIAAAIADDVSAIDEANAATYRQNYETFAAKLEVLHDRVHDLEPSTTGLSVAITEPVPLYLVSDAGLVNATPEAFSEAIEEGTDVSPAVLKETLGLFGTGDIAFLAYNDQTAGPETEQVRDAAEAAGVPVVDFTETLPEGEDYLGWMTANVDAIESALG
ncbi:MAG: hypothetical protein RI885_1806 [Actinomycetota bacterium]